MAKATKEKKVEIQEEPIDIQKSVVSSESSQPNYVELEAQRHKESLIEGFYELSETEFLTNLVSKAESGGWKSPLVDEIKHRIEFLSNK